MKLKIKLVAAAACGLLLSGVAQGAQGAEVKVLASGAVKEAALELLPQFEKASGNKVVVTWAGTVDIKKKIAAGEGSDVALAASAAPQTFAQKGTIPPARNAAR